MRSCPIATYPKTPVVLAAEAVAVLPIILDVVLFALCHWGESMAVRNLIAHAFACCVLIICSSSELKAQQFADPAFRSYTLRSTQPTAIEDSLRRFLDDRLRQGETIEIVSDNRAQRLLIRGSDEVQQLAKQFIQALDLPSIAAQPPVGQAPNVQGYFAASDAELSQKEASLRQLFANRSDVRIATDLRTRQLVVHAPTEIQRQIAANWNNPKYFAAAPQRQNAIPNNALVNNAVRNNQVQNSQAQNILPTNALPVINTRTELKLENITWEGLLKSLGGVQGSKAVTSPAAGKLEINVTGKDGNPTNFLIDQNNQRVQITGPRDSTQQWSRVVQSLDAKPANQNETSVTGRLGNANASSITRTITMLNESSGDPRNQLARPLNPVRGAAQNFAGQGQAEAMQLAQAGQPPVAPGQPGVVEQSGDGDVARMLMQGDASGSFLGPVAIEFIEGTDIFIVRGQKRDVDRVMRLINEIETLTQDTKPTIEVYPLKHANSSALAELINQLNETVLTARQGDINVTALVKPNSILLIGRPNGVESVKEIIKQLDVEAEGTDQFEIFQLKFVPAVDAETTINNLYNVTATQQQGTDTTPTLGARVRAVADYRSNSVIVQASPRDIEEIRTLVNQIDVKDSAKVAEVRVFQLKNAIAEEVAEVLNETLQTRESVQNQGNFGGQQGGGGAGAGGQVNTQAQSSPQAMSLVMRKLDAAGKKLLDSDQLASGILANVIVSSNERSNSVVVTAPKGSMDLIAEIVRQLDELPAQEAEIRVFNIVNGDANLLVEMLNSLFQQDQNTDGPLIQSAAGTGESTLVPLRFALDQRTNSIIASGNGADLRVVEAILLKLDASDVSRRKSAVVELQIQEAQNVADAITQFVLQRRQALQTIAVDTVSQFDLLDQEVVVVAEPASNKLIVNATDRYFDDIMEVIRELDKRPDMVMVQVMIAEVTLNSTEEMGVELGIQDSLLFNRGVVDATTGNLIPGFNFNNQALGNNAANPGSARDQVAGQALSDFGLGRTNSELGFGGLVLSASNESVSVLIRALQESRRLDVLSRPQVMMLNNTTGRVQVGASVPFISGTNNVLGNVQNTVEFRDVGLILDVTPRISPDGLIVLQVSAERSDLGSVDDGVPIAVNDGAVLRVPIFEATRADTFVTARDGQTVILGGLITKERAAFERKVPYLGDVPFFGRLFRTDGIAEERTELLIVLTPQIVRDEADVDRINSEEYARMSWCLGDVIEMHGDVGPGRRYYRDDNYPTVEGNEGMVIDQGTAAYNSPNDFQGSYEYPASDYSTYSPNGGQEIIEALPPANSVPVPQPQVIPTEAFAPPTSAAPPMPTVELPQANRQRAKSVLLNSPRSASLFPFSKRPSLKAPSSTTKRDPNLAQRSQTNPRVKRVSFDGQESGNKVRNLGVNYSDSERAVFARFDELPGE